MKQHAIWILGGALLVVLLGTIGLSTHEEPVVIVDDAGEGKDAATVALSPLDGTYLFDGEEIALLGGTFEREAAPGSVTKETFRVFGVPKIGDLDGDGDADAALYLVRDGGGSGSFYYVAFAMNDDGSYRGTNAMFLGDRIAPQTLEIRDANAIANFAERKDGESFATPPSVGKSVIVHYDRHSRSIGELAKDFEGEADPSRMTLGMKTWSWRSTTEGGSATLPKRQDVFTLAFGADSRLSVGTDCNSMGGAYVAKGSSLALKDMVSTLMFCEGSQETEFAAMLARVARYEFDRKGELHLFSKDGMEMIFR